MTTIGPLFPDAYAFGWGFALLVPLVLLVLGLLLLYVVIRRAVAAGIRDAQKDDGGAAGAPNG